MSTVCQTCRRSAKLNLFSDAPMCPALMTLVLQLSSTIKIFQHEVVITAIRSQGPGGQHVNTASTAICLQFDSASSSLPQKAKLSISQYNDRRINSGGIITIKAQRFRSQEKNRQDALERLASLLTKALAKDKYRVPSKATRSSIEKRLTKKKNKATIKRMRKKPTADD